MTVSTEPANAAAHAPPEGGAVTVQALPPPSAIPAPASVMAIPALAPAVSATEEVNDTVALVDVAATLDARATERSFIHEIPGNVPDVVESVMAGAVADRSLEVPAATLLKPACAFDGVVNDVTTTATSADGL